jgi:hypothetical protein
MTNTYELKGDLREVFDELSPRYGIVPFDANDGESWACASDGHRVLAVRLSAPFEAKPIATHDAIKTRVRGWVESKERGRVTKMESLLTWAGEKPKPVLPDCAECKNEGEIECRACYGSGECECSCGHEHECKECDGSGELRCDCAHGKALDDAANEKKEPGLLIGCLLDRRLLRHVFRPLGAEMVEIVPSKNLTSEPVVFRADGWMFALMGLRPDGSDEPFQFDESLFLPDA